MMIEEVAAAFERQDYREATRLLRILHEQSPENPAVQFYIGRLHEATGKLEAAEKVYRLLLRSTTIPKILAQARQGLKRLEIIEQEKRAAAIAQAKADPRNAEPAVLILEPVSNDAKAELAKQFARILKVDPYTARMQIPSRGWRFYRSGNLGELSVYGQELRDAGLPVFWATLAEVEKINVFRVSHFQSLGSQPSVVCQNQSDQLGTLTFKWSEVTKRVEGLLPLFEDVVNYDMLHNKLTRKEATHDYAQILDLHLPNRHCILRLCDQTYQFQKGIDVIASAEKPVEKNPGTTRIKWNHLMDAIARSLPNIPVLSDFTVFGETAVDCPDLLSTIPSHVDLFRKAESAWDPAFHLYSGLIFLRK